ncbi:hypothetical protein EVAR_80745_1 [Eumeta japonica]|uniref:Uncharacterized protein n=1 Tax=Eumeta variegata TaxID=151549 RepID=A0A4C1X6K5_EUMVA|nr:hypothetical protein EVAR_80745_1 [Eumeta japonica]
MRSLGAAAPPDVVASSGAGVNGVTPPVSTQSAVHIRPLQHNQDRDLDRYQEQLKSGPELTTRTRFGLQQDRFVLKMKEHVLCSHTPPAYNSKRHLADRTARRFKVSQNDKWEVSDRAYRATTENGRPNPSNFPGFFFFYEES